ncbi:NAD(P)H-dependent glycerol-3-phosphate dehydrogenase [Paratractidigestivibacter sp.]|uniref:NAD(P)H-dependent glycerol-3-phosphate dehydrogenase n=1 Tax=Paratractidigestivibacter sp. TaxID=2847316 RepID=UPI002ABE9DE5|nr:NAD(P)H-dependent glycerol-3-phosphate dehydrogenase [Paratractidigestivibacter sp.]
MSTGRADKVAVVGSGSWGTAFTGLLAPHVDEVVLWCRSDEVARAISETRRNPRHLTDYELEPNVVATSDARAALQGAELVVLALPSAHLRATCAAIADDLSEDALVLVLTKGIEPTSHKLMLDVAADELGLPSRMAVLSGPNHAEEICRHQVSAAVIAANEPQVAARVQELVVSPSFRAYVSADVAGVEVCGAVKNVVAIACGVAAGAGAGDNTLAVLMTRGIAEIGRLSTALGGDPLTPMGLAGMGDLVATCTSEHSRNRTFGEALVAGESLAHYESRTLMVVEGARAAMSVHELALDLGIEAPITAAVHGVLVDGLDAEAARAALLGRLPREEFYGMSDSGKE